MKTKFLVYLVILISFLIALINYDKVLSWVWRLNSGYYRWEHVKTNRIPPKLGNIDRIYLIPDNSSDLEYIAIINDMASSVSWRCKVLPEDFYRFTKRRQWKIRENEENYIPQYYHGIKTDTSPDEMIIRFLSKTSAPQIELLYNPKTQILYGNYANR